MEQFWRILASGSTSSNEHTLYSTLLSKRKDGRKEAVWFSVEHCEKMTTRPTYHFDNNAIDGMNASNHGGTKRGLFSRTRPKPSYSHGDDNDPTDGNASLTYSAASSGSGGSAAGESTDSSFADIMRVLDLQDSQELKVLMKKEGVSSVEQFKNKRLQSGLSQSSLAYSFDEGSQLDGAQMLQTLAG